MAESSSGNLMSVALKNGGQVVEDRGYLLAVKEGTDTVERSSTRGGRAKGVPVEQSIVVNTYEGGPGGSPQLVSSEERDIPQYPDRKLKVREQVPEQVPEPVDEEIPSLKEEIEMSSDNSKHVTIETADMEMRVRFEDVIMNADSGQASLVYDPDKPCSLPMKGRKVRILADDLPPFSAMYEGTDFEIPRAGGLRLRLLTVCED